MALAIGYAQATITPALARPVFLAGFGRNRRAASVHDDLYVRALALREGDVTVVLAAVDLIGLARQAAHAHYRARHGGAAPRRRRAAGSSTATLRPTTQPRRGGGGEAAGG